MKKVSDAVRAIVLESAFLRFGFQYQLLNLTQLAKFIQPLIEARVKKEITPSAIVMSLSRLGRELDEGSDRGFFQIHNLVVHTDLLIVTLYKTPENHKEVNNVYRKVQKREGLITVTEGLTEITVILEAKHEMFAEELLENKPKRIDRKVGSLTVKFDDRYLETPGFLYAVLRQVALQGINIKEVSSTSTEFILYLAESDIQLAFDTLYRTFSSRNQHGLIPG
ncbi:MAG: hypothetical protein KDD70_17685 [Bdellovibrionales bacterium]|nr:hypothetical protein [Bdellovibrionales bacterium]